MDKKLLKLKNYNFIMGFLHLVQGLAMLALSNNFTLPITTSFLKWDDALGVPVSNTETVYELKVGIAIASFLLLSSFFHFLIATGGFKKYVGWLKKGANYFRWWEYSLSSSIMIVVIAMLCGFYDLGGLILIFSLNASMIFFGLMMELHNQTTKTTDWSSFLFGCFAGFIPWVIIGMYFVGAASSVDAIPKFVYGILVSLFIFFNIFALNMVLQYKKIGPWKDYLYGERVYILLSLIAKSALAWQVFSGTLR